MYRNKKGQLEYPIITFIIVVIAIIFLGPFMLKIIKDVTTPFADAVGNQTDEAGQNVRFVRDTFVNFWDWVLIIAFLINIILLFISAFLVDTHPAFLILYILFAVFTMIFAPMILESVNQIYDSAEFVDEVAQIPMLDFLRTYFGLIIIGIIFISGVIMYGKYKLFPSQPFR